jgi:beta-mannanase
VADGKFDAQYKQFFALVKSGDLKVIFRTMHEMNGGRYPRSSNPEAFKKAWIHVWNLSRAAGLTTQNILFDMSLNDRDLPAKNGKPSQTATFIQCQPALKAKLHCPTFEDYYPGDKYVDLLGVTFYNRGK